MRKQSMKILAVTLAAAMLPAFASIPPRNPATEAEANATRAQQLANRFFREHGGKYRLQDGAVLHIVKEGNRLYAQIDNGSRFEVNAVARDLLVSTDKKVSLRFSDTDTGQVTMTKPAGLL